MNDFDQTIPANLPMALLRIDPPPAGTVGTPPTITLLNEAARRLLEPGPASPEAAPGRSPPALEGLAQLLWGNLHPHLDPQGLLHLELPGREPVRARVTRRHDPDSDCVWVVLDDQPEDSQSHEAVLGRQLALEAEVDARTRRAEARTAEIRALALDAVHAEEKERARIARVLHDGLQQLLVAAKIHASRMPGLDDRATRATVAKTLVELIDGSIESSRRLTEELGSTTLTHGDLPAALERLARWLRRHHGLQVHLDIEAHSGMPANDVARLLVRCARELLFNITKHAGTDQAWVSLDRELRGGEVMLVLEVADEGKGGATLTPSSRGTGLGLHDLSRRVTLVGGSLELQSPVGGGTKARVHLPWRRGQEEAITDEVDGAAITLVLVDDHALVRQSIATAISDEPGLEVVGEAADGPEALEVIRRLRPQVVVMDVDLPSTSGIALTRILRDEGHPSRVLGLSMHDDPSVEQAMLAAGALAFLSKGGPMDDLIRAIRRAAHGSGS